MQTNIQSAAAFADLSESGVDFLSTTGSWMALAPGQDLYEAGDETDAFYLLAEGQLQILLPNADGAERIASTLGPGDIAGEIQILTGGRRNARARAAGAARVICFPREAFERLTFTEPAFFHRIRALALHQLRRRQLAAILPSLFGDLDLEQMREIESLGKWVELRKGEILVRQGDAGDGASFLVSGLLSVSINEADGSSRVVNHIHHGEVVGEMALITGAPRAATVRAARDSILLFLGAKEFAFLADRYSRFMLGIARLNIRRLQHSMSMERPAGVTSVTALLPTSAAVPLAGFAGRLAEKLSGYCSVLHVDRKRLQSIVSVPDDSPAALDILINARFPAWLCSEEGKHRIILLETDANDPLWSERCVRQADQVLVVGLADADPALSDIELRCVFRSGEAADVRKRLILLHPDTCDRPRGTARWLRDRAVEMHHHVRLGNDADISRLARFLTDSAICVAMGGGGARGFTHIGVLRALEEDGVPIDIVGGTSMGAVIAAEHALGMSPDRMLEVNRHLFSNTGLLFDVTLPLLSFTSGKAYARTLKRTFGEAEIEDLWIPFFCVSSNISRAERAIHRSGLLRRKVRASSGVQGMFPPVVLDGELHVDGAPFSNLPADAMKTVCEGKVIAIDVSPPVDLVRHTDYGEAISGWKILWRRVFPGKEGFRVADIGTIMQRSGEAASMANQKVTIERMSDYYLKMPVDDVGLFAFSALPKVARIGYEHTKKKIAEWRAEGTWITP